MAPKVFLAVLMMAAVCACGQHHDDSPTARADDSGQPELAQPAPTDSTYSGAAGRTQDSGTETAAPAADADFVRSAAEANLLEMQAGQLATNKAQSAAVKKYAEMLVHDHSVSTKALQQIAADKGVEVPARLAPEREQSIAKLQQLSGAEFDRTFAKEMVSGHEEAVQLYERAAQSSSDSEIKAYAEKTLPTLRRHLKVAQSLPDTDSRG